MIKLIKFLILTFISFSHEVPHDALQRCPMPLPLSPDPLLFSSPPPSPSPFARPMLPRLLLLPSPPQVLYSLLLPCHQLPCPLFLPLHCPFSPPSTSLHSSLSLFPWFPSSFLPCLILPPLWPCAPQQHYNNYKFSNYSDFNKDKFLKSTMFYF